MTSLSLKKERDFNPRSREGSDHEVTYYDGITKISIHAPARGATLIQAELQQSSGISIHAPARGATIEQCHEVMSRIFQSTLPRGERLQSPLHYPLHGTISIHAPARGATLIKPWHLFNYLFQSTLPRGERQDIRN